MKMEPTVSSETLAIRTQDAVELRKKEHITWRMKITISKLQVALKNILIIAISSCFSYYAMQL